MIVQNASDMKDPVNANLARRPVPRAIYSHH